MNLNFIDSTQNETLNSGFKIDFARAVFSNKIAF